MKYRPASALLLSSLFAAPALAANLPARAPGLWQSTTTVLSADGQPLANAVDVVTVSCVDLATDQKFLLSGANECSSLTLSGDGGSYKINGVCAQQGRPVTINESLTYTDAKDVQLTALFTSGAQVMTVKSELVWKGACLTGMEPGDEGNIVNGAFSKAGNINDPNNS